LSTSSTGTGSWRRPIARLKHRLEAAEAGAPGGGGGLQGAAWVEAIGGRL
jgi:hypothetical protein